MRESLQNWPMILQYLQIAYFCIIDYALYFPGTQPLCKLRAHYPLPQVLFIISKSLHSHDIWVANTSLCHICGCHIHQDSTNRGRLLITLCLRARCISNSGITGDGVTRQLFTQWVWAGLSWQADVIGPHHLHTEIYISLLLTHFSFIL